LLRVGAEWLAGAFSLLVLVHGLSGPLIGWLVERFRPRAVIAIGGGVLAGALLLGAQIQSVWQLYAVFGVLVALGMSAAGWVPSVVLIRAWFPSRVGTALGAAPAGIGVGIFALVPLTQLLTAPLTPAIASDLFGGPRFPRIFGLLQVTNSLGGAIGAWIAGVIFDLTASYARALPIAAGMALLAPGLLWFVAPRRPSPPPLG
jgi:MFS transporter, OFA family, oxalate/formate antiporter